MYKRLVVAVVLALLVGLFPMLLLDAKPASGQSIPTTKFAQEGFTDTFVTNVDTPTALTFTPDGRMLVTNQQGRLYVYQDGKLLSTPALDVSGRICSNSERGLLGLAVDPQFAGNRYVYVYYTANSNGRCVNRVSRFVLGDNNVATGERVLFNNIYSANTHNAGDLKFGNDGLLYVSVGDGGRPRDARVKNILIGKILRINRDGSIPAANPYRGSGTARCNISGQVKPGVKCQEIFASGLRNPFRMAFDPNYKTTTRFYINDVGQTKWEEVNLGRTGADYGWDLREGPCAKDSYTSCGSPTVAGLTNPINSYPHSTGCSSITGGAFMPYNAWSSNFNTSYLYADFACNKIFKLTPVNGKYARSAFAYNMAGGGPVALVFGPNNALYYTTYSNGGEVHRIEYQP